MAGYFERYAGSVTHPVESSTRVGLRPAQVAAVHAVNAHFFQRADAGLVTMPTGSGKTAVMILSAFALGARRVLVIAPGRLLREQWTQEFRKLSTLRTLGSVSQDFPEPAVVECKHRIESTEGWQTLEGADVVVGTVASLNPGTPDAAEPPADLFDVILVDEAHHAPARTWRDLLAKFPSARALMFTATPFRLDGALVPGRMIFTYGLARARQDGVFGRLQFEPVEPPAGEPADDCLAVAAAARLAADANAGFRHYLMVRVDTRKRADELLEVYRRKTTLRVEVVSSDLSMSKVRKVIDKLRAGELDGVICVNMMGEGFDLPRLKIAALHSPHRSLAVTLQFIGRFARTTGTDTGPATFLAVPSEIQIDAARLYQPGAEWNELVEEAAARTIEEEGAIREALEAFDAQVAPDIDGLSLHNLAPYFHVKVLQTTVVDLTVAAPATKDMTPVFESRTDSAVVWVFRTTTPCAWSLDNRIADVRFDLVVAYRHVPTRLVFICSTLRSQTMYGLVRDAITPEGTDVPPDLLNRVLTGLTGPEFYSIGMRNRVGVEEGESYRMITGRAADRVLSREDGQHFDRGHCFGKGLRAGVPETIGVAASSKVWSNRWDRLPSLLTWCEELAERVGNAALGHGTNSGLDFLPVGVKMVAIPPGVFFAELPDCFFGANFQILGWSGVAAVDAEVLQAEILDQTDIRLDFRLVCPELGLAAHMRFSRDGTYLAMDETARHLTVRGVAGDSVDLCDFLRENQMNFFTYRMERVEGTRIFIPPAIEPADTSLCERITWNAEGVNIELEKPTRPPTGNSLFEWLERRIVASDAVVVFCDDDAAEMADYITLAQRGDRVDVEFYHCKASSKAAAGQRQADFFEVCGQSVRTRRWFDTAKLLRQMRHRSQNKPERYCKGLHADAERLLALAPGKWRVNIVQPGLDGSELSAEISHLLASTDSFLRKRAMPLRVFSS